MKLGISAGWLRCFLLQRIRLFALFSILTILVIASPIKNAGGAINLWGNTPLNSFYSPLNVDQTHADEKAVLNQPSYQNDPAPLIKLKFRLDKIQIGLIQNFSVRNHQIFLLGSYGLAILDLDQNQTPIKRFRNTPVGIDNRSQIWYLTDNSTSIFRWDGQTTTEYRKEQGWILPAKFSNPPIPQQRTSFFNEGQKIWLATSSDVRFYNGENWRIFTANEIGIQLPYKVGVESIFTINSNPSNGDIWTAACYWQDSRQVGGSVPFYFDGKTWRRSDFPEENPCITSIIFSSDGSGFFTTPTSIWVYDGQAWSEIFSPQIQNLPQNTNYQISQVWMDHSEAPWFLAKLINLNGLVTQYVLFHYTGTTLKMVSSLEGFAQPQIFFTSSGSVICFRINQLFLLTPTGWVLLGDNKFDLVAQDNHSNVWLISDIKNRPVLWELIE